MNKERFKLNSNAQNQIDIEFGDTNQNNTRKNKKTATPKRAKTNAQNQFSPLRHPIIALKQTFAREGDVPLSDRIRRFYNKFAIVVIILGLLVIGVDVVLMYFRGVLWFNEPRKRDYPVRGAIVTSDLGEIDWEEFQLQTISFAYIRATKGTTFVDEQLESNMEGSYESRLLIGYYHEFDFRTDGEAQAEHFIEEVGELSGYLRPAVKITRYGIYNLHMKSADKVDENIREFLHRIKKEYGRRAVIMCDKDCYEKYIKDEFSTQTLWIIDHFSEPEEPENWALWEFNPRMRTEGYTNKKEYWSISCFRKEKDLNNFRKNMLIE